MHIRLACAVSLIPLAWSYPAVAQNAVDRADPTRAEERVENDIQQDSEALPPPTQVEAAPEEASGPALTVGAIDLVGLQAMSRAQFADIVEDYIGRTLSAAELAEMADRLAARARASFPLASATIEPQTVRGGVLQVRIDEGTIDEVRLDGPANGAVLAALRPLASGRPVSSTELERRLLLAGDVDGVSLGQSRIVQEDGRNILVVRLAYRKFRGQIALDNDSTKPVGPLEVFGSARFNGLLADDDSLQLFALNTIPEVSELSYARARYSKRLTASGTELLFTGTYSRSTPGSYLEPLEIEGQSWMASVGLQHPLLRSRRTSLWIEGALSHRQLDRDRMEVLTRKDQLTVFRAGLSLSTLWAGGRLSANLSGAQGLDLLGATAPGDPLASRDDADGTFTTVAFSADWAKTIVDGFGLKLGVRSQLASQALLLSEEIGIGGAIFGRGYDYSERSGDEGAMAYGELLYEWDREIGPLDGLELYAFADGGEVTNLASGFGGGSLFSSGGGLRADVDSSTDAAFEVAVPLSGPRYDSNNEDPRIRFSVTRYF